MDGTLRHSPFDALLGTEWLSDDPDDARARLAVAPHHKQPIGLVHGGVYSTLVESICSRATALALREEGKLAVGQQIAVSFLRPITEGHVNVSARVRHRGSTSWVWDAEVSDDEGRLCALARMTAAVRPAPR